MLVLLNLAPDTRVSFNFGASTVSLPTHCHPTCVRLEDRQTCTEATEFFLTFVTDINTVTSMRMKFTEINSFGSRVVKQRYARRFTHQLRCLLHRTDAQFVPDSTQIMEEVLLSFKHFLLLFVLTKIKVCTCHSENSAYFIFCY